MARQTSAGSHLILSPTQRLRVTKVSRRAEQLFPPPPPSLLVQPRKYFQGQRGRAAVSSAHHQSFAPSNQRNLQDICVGGISGLCPFTCTWKGWGGGKNSGLTSPPKTSAIPSSSKCKKEEHEAGRARGKASLHATGRVIYIVSSDGCLSCVESQL